MIFKSPKPSSEVQLSPLRPSNYIRRPVLSTLRCENGKPGYIVANTAPITSTVPALMRTVRSQEMLDLCPSMLSDTNGSVRGAIQVIHITSLTSIE